METVQVDDVTFTRNADGSVVRRVIRGRNVLPLLLYSLVEVSFAALAYIASRAALPNVEARPWLPFLISGLVAVFTGVMIYRIFRDTRVPDLWFNAKTRIIEAPSDRYAESVPYSQVDVIETVLGTTRADSRSRYTVRIVLKDEREIRVATVSGAQADAEARGKTVVKLIAAATGARVTGPLAETPKPAPRARPAAPAAKLPKPKPGERLYEPKSGPLVAITDALARMYKEGAPDSTIVLRPEGSRSMYIRVTGQAKRAPLFAEAAGNEQLDESEQLSQEKLKRLNTLGWMSPRGNNTHYYRQWMVISNEERERVAGQIIRVLTDIYGWSTDKKLDIEENLAGKPAPDQETQA